MSGVLVIQAESRILNPLLDQEMIEAELSDDREAASSEWLGQFRTSTVQFLEDALIDRAVVAGRIELPFSGHQYVAFTDPSGGRHDAFTLAIAHKDGDRVVLDKTLVQRPPFEPEAVVERFCLAMRDYGLSTVTGDRYAGTWVSTAFSRYGVSYLPSELDKSGIYGSILPLFAQDRVELLEIPQLITELRLLERRPRAGGRADSIDHPPKAHDDLANAVAGAFHLAESMALDASPVFPSDWIHAAQSRWQSVPMVDVPVSSLGVARKLSLTVVAWRCDGWYAPLITGTAADASSIAGFVVAQRRDDAVVVVDLEASNGVEVVTHLRTNGVAVKGFRGQVESIRKTEDRQLPFADRLSEAAWRFREALNPDQFGGSFVQLPTDAELVADLMAFSFEVTAKGIEVTQVRPAPRAEAVLLSWSEGPTHSTHSAEWRARQRFSPGRRGHSQPKVNLGPRRSRLGR